VQVDHVVVIKGTLLDHSSELMCKMSEISSPLKNDELDTCHCRAVCSCNHGFGVMLCSSFFRKLDVNYFLGGASLYCSCYHGTVCP